MVIMDNMEPVTGENVTAMLRLAYTKGGKHGQSSTLKEATLMCVTRAHGWFSGDELLDVAIGKCKITGDSDHGFVLCTEEG